MNRFLAFFRAPFNRSLARMSKSFIHRDVCLVPENERKKEIQQFARLFSVLFLPRVLLWSDLASLDSRPIVVIVVVVAEVAAGRATALYT